MKYRIYVIEDDENIRNLICVALENFGYCASGFETAEEALDSLSDLLRRGREAQREYPAMFVFDWMLPGMDGMAAIRKIREMPDFAAAPVLMLTAKDREMDIVQGLDNGADDYMTKPFGILELSARVRNLLKRVEPAKEEVSSLTIGEVSINRETREVIACGDRTIDYAVVEDFVFNIEAKYGVTVMGLGFDRMNCLSSAQKWENGREANEFHPASAGYTVCEVKQHSSVLHPATKWLSEMITDGKFAYEPNDLLEINFENARCTFDTNLNRYVNKKRSAGKVDMVVALINAVHMLQQNTLFGEALEWGAIVI